MLYRAHGVGNDYLVWEAGTALHASLVQALCDRHRGVGGDGVLEPLAIHGTEARLRIWNPDGSIAEKSGNGLRIFAHWLVAVRGLPVELQVSLQGERIACRVEGSSVRVEMGRGTFEPEAVPAHRRLLDTTVDVGGDSLALVAVGLGNPHCVVFREEPDLDALPWQRWGSSLERSPLFPRRTNVQFARLAAPGCLEMRVWERGVGPTLASGSSACAVALAAVETGRARPGPLQVVMPGGALEVTVAEDRTVSLEGPVEPIGRVELDPGWLERRGVPTALRGR